MVSRYAMCVRVNTVQMTNTRKSHAQFAKLEDKLAAHHFSFTFCHFGRAVNRVVVQTVELHASLHFLTFYSCLTGKLSYFIIKKCVNALSGLFINPCIQGLLSFKW